MSEKNIVKPSDLLKTEHWAVLNYTSITTPGYDKGDPNERKEIVEYLMFSSKTELETWVKEATQGYARKTFSVVFVKPAKVETTVSVKIA